MRKYEKLEIEIKNLNVDIITKSPEDYDPVTPGMGVEDDMLG